MLPFFPSQILFLCSLGWVLFYFLPESVYQIKSLLQENFNFQVYYITAYLIKKQLAGPGKQKKNIFGSEIKKAADFLLTKCPVLLVLYFMTDVRRPNFSINSSVSKDNRNPTNCKMFKEVGANKLCKYTHT